MSESITVGEGIVRLLEAAGVGTAFGIISIHNMPLLDAITRRGKIRFVPSRGEAGGANMADAFARVSGGLGVVGTSTGTAAEISGSAVPARAVRPRCACAASPSRRLVMATEAAFSLCDRVTRSMDAATNLRSASASAHRVLWGPSYVL